MALAGELAKYVGKELVNTGSKALQKATTGTSTELLRNALVDVATKGGIDTASKGFGKQLLAGIKNKIYNSTAGEAQELINAFPALYRGDYGDVGNDLISSLKNDGGAVLSAYASNPYFNMSKTPRTLGISRSSFDQFLSNPNNGILANARNEVIGSPRTSMLYNGNSRDAYDVLDQVRKSVMDTAEKNGTIGDLRSYSSADDYVSDLLEEIYSRSPRVNEIKMPLGPRSITSIKNFGEDAPRVLQNDARIALANGEMVNVPANSLFGNFEGLNANNPNSRALLSPDALNNNPREVIYSKLNNDYGADKAREIMAYYGGDIGKSTKSGKNSFLGRMLSGQEVENPLVMYHGVDKSKLRQMLDIADETYSDYALANPSLQVIDPTKNTGGDYGDIILLGNKTIPSSMDKYSGGVDYGSKYNLYSRDIYSPRKPEIVYNKGVPVIEGTRTRATPSNISDYMNKQGTKAVESNFTTPGSMAATQSKRLKSPLEAIKNSDLLKPENELKEAFDGWNKDVTDRVQSILDNYMATTDPNINPYSYSDYISSELQDAMAGKKGWDDPYGINTTDKGKAIVKELKDKASKLPTAYFEAKAKRAVPLKEFGGVILPEGFSDPRIEQALKDSGLEVLGRYDPNNYQESLGSTLRNLIKGKDRLDTPYMLSKAEPDAKYAKLVDKAKGYKSLDRFEKMNNPIKGSEIWGEKPTSVFQRDSRAVRVNMFPNDAVKGTGITKQYLLNLFKDAYDQGITDIVPSYGSYTKEGASFMDHLAEQGWVKDTSKNGWKSYEISPKIAEWEKTSPLADIYNDAHNIPEVQQSKIGLSPQQQEFFKDSVVRDKEGNLMPVFHTTNTNKRINKFNADNGMVWVTPNKMYSTGFAGDGYNPNRTYELYADIKKPVYIGNIDPAINDETIERLSAYTGVDEESLLAIAEKYDARNIWNITNTKDFKELMQAKGYDGIEAREGGNQISYAAFSPEQIKNVDNLKPTSNPDIRYAKDTGRSLVEMHKRLMAMNKSRELDPNVKRIGNSAVAEIDEKTLPAGYEKVKKYLEASPNDVLYNALGVNLDDVDVSEWGDIIKNWIEEQGYEADKNVANNLSKVREIVAEQLAEELSLDGSPYAKFVQTRNALAKDNPGKGVGVKSHTISANNDQIHQTDAGKLDREYSERLGIGRSHTPMSDNAVAGDAQGVYFAGGIGVKPEFAQGETGVSTIAHERLHSWQDARRGEWDDRVIDAIDDLRGELKDFYHTKDQIKKYRKSGESLDYYANENEQEARMLQSYLDNEGYTNTWKKNVADGTEWGDEVKPAFDKFYKKLRSLSKAGVALPAIAVLFGLNTNTGKKLDKKS